MTASELPLPGTWLTPAQRRTAAWHCDIEKRGRVPYCFTHHSEARDLIACLDVEDQAEQLIESARRPSLPCRLYYRAVVLVTRYHIPR